MAGLCLPARAAKVTFPLTLDHAFLRAALINRIYTLPGEKAEVYRADGGCTMIEVWNPRINTRGGYMRTVSAIRVRTGVEFMDKCLSPLEWSGNIELYPAGMGEPGHPEAALPHRGQPHSER